MIRRRARVHTAPFVHIEMPLFDEGMKRYGKNASRIRLQRGEAFVLALPAHASAGYAWQLTAQPEVTALREGRIRPSGKALGAPSTYEFEFAGVRAGSGILVMECKRPWEATAAERLEVEVVVDS